MAEPIVSFIVENDEAFANGLKRLAATTSDFRIPFGLIGNHWYRGNKKIFALKSAGLYPGYGGFNYNEKVMYRGQLVTKRKKAEEEKKRKFGFIFPMLKREGRLEKSLMKGGSGAEYFVGRQELIMGTNVEYAKFHQSDQPRATLPQRKMIFIDGGPAEKAKDALISGRREAWLNIINDYIFQITEEYKNG